MKLLWYTELRSISETHTGEDKRRADDMIPAYFRKEPL